MQYEARIMELQEDEFSLVSGKPIDLEDAAELYAAEVDSNMDYAIMNAGEMLVEVREVGKEEIQTFKVVGEARPSYHAYYCKETEPKNFIVEYRTGHDMYAPSVKETILAKNKWDAERIVRIQSKNKAWRVRVREEVLHDAE